MSLNLVNIKRNISWGLILIVIFSTIFNVAFAEESTWDPNFHSEGWINKDENWWNGTDRRGCYLSVKNNRTGKYSVAIYDRFWPDNIVISDDGSFMVGDPITVDAYTSYAGGTYWIYRDDELIQTQQGGANTERFNIPMNITTRKTKISCSASSQSINGEELSVTIIATGDLEKPVITMTDTTVAVNKTAYIEITDNEGVTGWAVTPNNVSPGEYTPVTPSSKRVPVTYTPDYVGAYYVWARDALNNVSEPFEFFCGNPPEPASRTISGQTSVIVPYDTGVRSGDNATFSLSVEGTAPLSFQWYSNTENSTTGGNRIVGANQSSYTIHGASKSQDGMYYYCVISNDYGEATSRAGKLTVYYKPILATINGADVKKNDFYDMVCRINVEGNTDSYTYQWFKADSSDGVGTRIVGATSKTYRVVPKKNVIEWFYCEVYNHLPDGGVLYITTSNHVKIVSDVTAPEISLGEFDQERHYNKQATFTVPLVVKEVGQGYEENGSNFTSTDVVVAVNGATQEDAVKSIHYDGYAGNGIHNYTLQVSNVSGNGRFSLRFPADGIKDKFGNTNDYVMYDTKVMIDNKKPTIILYTVESGYNDVYLNHQGTLKLRIGIFDTIGIQTNEFTADDIRLKVGGIEYSDFDRTVTYKLNSESYYYYDVTLSSVTGDGELVINIPEGKIRDFAGNLNDDTDIPIELASGKNIIIDNTIPRFLGDIVVRIGSDESERIYPTSLDTWHNNWSNESLYITINAEDKVGSRDEGAIDYYTYSVDNRKNFVKLEDNKHVLDKDYNGLVWYRIFDKAGNFVDRSVSIKIDKTPPTKTELGIYESRRYGANYIYKPDFPTNKNIYIYPKTPQDLGSIQSGIKLNQENGKYFTYYSITGYKDRNKEEVIMDEHVYSFANDGNSNFTDVPNPFTENGFYEIKVRTTDIAGNVSDTNTYYVYIRKIADNTIRIKNIEDIGSGAKTLTISVYRANASGGKTANKAVDDIIVNNPLNSYETMVGLGRGTFYVVATIEDGVGLTWEDEVKITNDF